MKCFSNSCVNLLGFSLGCLVITECLLELEKLKRFDIIYDVYFLAGAVSV